MVHKLLFLFFPSPSPQEHYTRVLCFSCSCLTMNRLFFSFFAFSSVDGIASSFGKVCLLSQYRNYKTYRLTSKDLQECTRNRNFIRLFPTSRAVYHYAVIVDSQEAMKPWPRGRKPVDRLTSSQADGVSTVKQPPQKTITSSGKCSKH